MTSADANPGDVRGDDTYPRISVSTASGRSTAAPASGLPDKRVLLRRLDDSDDALVTLVRQSLADGGCIGIVRNTVSRAQRTAEMLRDGVEVDVELVHSRYLATERLSREKELRKRLGPPAGGDERPQTLVVVGTQVLEQSLDVDFDLLVTDLAPTDLVLQRIGRLHRHQRGPDEQHRPPALRVATCWVTGCDWSTDPPTPIPGSRRIYGQASLLRALAVFERHWDDGLLVPRDIARLVREAYARDLPGPLAWAPAITEADGQRERAIQRSLARAKSYLLDQPFDGRSESLSGWVHGKVSDARDDTEGAAQVRDTEDGIEVIAVHQSSHGLRFMPGNRHSDTELLADFTPNWQVARALAGQTLRLPMEVARAGHGDQVIEHLERRTPAAWHESQWLAGQLVLTFEEDLTAELGDYVLSYDRYQGLIHVKKEQQ